MLDPKNIPYAKNEKLAPVAHPYTGDLGKAIDELNDRYSFVMMSGKHKVFDHQEKIFCELESVKIFQNQQILHNNKIVNPSTMWINDRELRRNFDKVVFRPYPTNDKFVDNHFNTWHGWAVEAVEQSDQRQFKIHVEPWLNHIHDVFCSGDTEQSKYFIQWIAHLFQKPEKKPGVAIVIQSGQGFGKGLLVTLLEKMIGHSYTARITDSHQVAGGFSGHMKDTILVNFDEATWGGDKKANGRLKAIITENHLTVEEKHKNAEKIEHFARFLITTNNKYSVPVEADDRRFFVPDVTNKKPSDTDFQPIIDINDNDEAIQYIFSYFMSLDISGFNITRFPDSCARQKLKAESVNHGDVYKAFILACYHEEELALNLIQPSINATELFKSFTDWKNSNTFRAVPVSMSSFGIELKAAGFAKKTIKGKVAYSITRHEVETYLKSINII